MDNAEVKTFNVKNISVRLVHIGGESIPPEQVRALIDDEAGINRAGVDESEYLEETDEDVTGAMGAYDPNPKPVAKPAKAKKGAPTATGAGWVKPS